MTTIHWTNDFQAACAQADLDHRLILLDFFSPTWGGCQQLSAVTYSETTVADTIKTHFVPVQINTQEAAGHAMVQCFHQVWTPDLRMLSSQGVELYHWNGYVPPFEFLPQLLVARVYACLALQDPSGAAAGYRQVLERFPSIAGAPEAQYCLAVSLSKHSHEASELLDNWHQLQTRYPNSLWRLKPSFVEKATGGRS